MVPIMHVKIWIAKFVSINKCGKSVECKDARYKLAQEGENKGLDESAVR